MTAPKKAAEQTPHASEIARREAEARKYDAEAAHSTAQTRMDLAVARMSELDADREDDKRKVELASDWRHHVYVFDSAVDAKSVKHCMAQIAFWARFEPGCDFEIIFNTPGGSVVDGLALFDFIRQTSRAGHTITTSALGMAASMGSILLQAGDHRKMARESWLLVHQVQASAMGSWGELEDRMKWLERIQERIIDIYVTRSAEAKKKGVVPISGATVAKNWTRTDWWLDSAEAYRHGLVDEVS